MHKAAKKNLSAEVEIFRFLKIVFLNFVPNPRVKISD